MTISEDVILLRISLSDRIICRAMGPLWKGNSGLIESKVLISSSFLKSHMPLLLKRKVDHNSELAVWHATESMDYFKDKLNLDAEEGKRLSEMMPHRQKEWLASRYLLHLISGDKVRRHISKRTTGKPYRIHCPKNISVSHSREHVACIISESVVGLDIQRKEDKIIRIQHKFISEEEKAHIPEDQAIDYYHVFWGAKESMYKAYGLKNLDFKKNMHLYPFKLMKGITEFRGYVKTDKIRQEYKLEVEKIDGAYLVNCIQEQNIII